ncbi:carbon monoxide dehydrogenase subunit G [Catenulispora sp. GP43]|uniref:hypothetical protein n=1 Tax=Catenulispora sp. GP43 TaxID=3156263 RepID=UPI003515CF8B
MAFEVEVPVRHRTMWLAFTDPEKMARAVPGLVVDAVHAVPPADGPEGVAGDVVAGRLKLRVGSGGAGATITYRGTACIAGAEAHKGTLDIAVDAAQARGSGALAGYLRVTLAPAGDAGERTLISVVPELELTGRALEFTREDWHGAVAALGTEWIEALAADYRDAEHEGSAVQAVETVVVVETAEVTEVAEVTEPAASAEALDVVEAVETPEVVEPAAEPANKSTESAPEKIADPLSEDPLAAVWSGRYEKNRWFPAIAALTLFLLIKRKRRHRADKPGADSSFRME